MKRVFLVVLVCLLPTLSFSHPNFSIQNVGNWYESGTLHKKTAKDWHLGRYRDRLATSADFLTVATPKHKQQTLFENNLRLLKVQSVALEKCITEATVDTSSRNLQVSEVAILCIVLLGINK
ncbi:MAG: hypothetical protein IH886_02740 [Nitrospinae bacterium]|nr:hypothetical protein [Nitrospinota bacterium]